jgi:hypothetical protein
LRQVKNLPAAAAPGDMVKNPRALQLRQGLLSEGIQAVRVGMEIELGS